MTKQPKKWIALILGFVSPFFGMLYVGEWVWAVGYLLGGAGIAIVFFLIFGVNSVVPIVAGVVFSLICAGHAYWLADHFPEGTRPPHYSRWYGLLVAALGVFTLGFSVRAFFIEPFFVPSSAMAPTMERGSYLLVKKWGYGHYSSYGISLFQKPLSVALQRGEVIAFDDPTDRSLQYIKRLVGLPGDTVGYRYKRLYINGNEIPHTRHEDYSSGDTSAVMSQFTERFPGVEYSVIVDDDVPAFIRKSSPFAFEENCSYDSQGVTCTVPEGHYYVIGDNRDNSFDSRNFGFVPADHIVGKVVGVFP